MSSDVEEATRAEAAVQRARTRWPAIGCTTEDLLARVQQLGAACGDLTLYGEELHLACACLHGDEIALRVLDRDYVSQVAPSLVRLGAERDFMDEVKQLLRQRLLLPPEPRLASYAATGPLLAWIRVVAVRIGLSLRRSTPPAADELRAEHLFEDSCVDASDVPRYRQALDAAIRRVFAQLALRDRNLLRLHYLDGLNLDRLGALYSVHRATVARWLADVRRRMLTQIEKEVSLELKLSASEFRSVLGMVQSHLDASISALLRAPELTL